MVVTRVRLLRLLRLCGVVRRRAQLNLGVYRSEAVVGLGRAVVVTFIQHGLVLDVGDAEEQVPKGLALQPGLSKVRPSARKGLACSLCMYFGVL